jgi:succinoglycan biosynthesis transport protein ExoP
MSTAVIDQTPVATEAPRRRIQSPLTLRDLLTPVFYYRRQAMLALMIPVILAFVAALMAHPVYVAQSRLLILLGGDYVFKGSASDPGSSQSFDRAQIVHAEMEILSARSLHIEAIKEIGLARAYPGFASSPNGLEQAADRLEKDLTIDNIPQSNVIEMSLRNADRQVSADLLNRLVALYVDRRREVFKRADASSVSAQRDGLSQRLDQLESQLTAFATEHNFGDYNAEFAAVQGQQAALQAQLQATDQQIAARAGRTSQLSRRLETTPSVVPLSTDTARSAQLDALTTSLIALQAQRREAAAKFRDGYPLIADLDAKIAALQAQIRQAPTSQTAAEHHGLNPVRQQLDSAYADSEGELAGLRSGRRALQASLAATNARLDELVRIGPQYRELQRARDVVEGVYQDLAKTAENASLENAMSRSRANVRVIQSADPPLKGKSGRMILLAAGLGLGLAAAFATVIISQALAEIMVTTHDVEEKLSLPALLAVNWNANRDPPARLKGGRLSPRFLTPDDARLILRLLWTTRPAGGRVLQLIGSSSGEGVSSLTLDIAAIAASHEARKVLLIDVEPQLNEGAANVLAYRGHAVLGVGAEARTFQVDNSSLYVSAPIGAGGMMVSEDRWGQVIENARANFDLVLIDSPPLQRSSAGIELAGLADMSLLVVEAEVTRASVARRLIERTEGAGGEIIGAILNKRVFHIPRFIYSRL